MTLKRPRHPMPAWMRRAILNAGLMEPYRRRPAYQRNDYIAWIARGKLDATKQRRLRQMLSELEHGDQYMKMAWKPRRTS
jgi:hypothetical protein